LLFFFFFVKIIFGKEEKKSKSLAFFFFVKIIFGKEEKMKKLINILGAIGIVASASTSVIACGGKNIKFEDEFIDNEIMSNNSYSNEMKKMYQATSFMSKMMILSRHENLNYYLNDIIQGTYSNNSLLVSQAAGAPSTITVKNSSGESQTIDINGTYIDPLNQEYTPMDTYIHKYSGSSSSIDLQSWMYSGMMDDLAYNDYIKKTISGGDTTFDYFNESTKGYEGMWRGSILTNDESRIGYPILKDDSNEAYRKDRLNLKWMQSNGPLSDYIFANDNLWKGNYSNRGERATQARAFSQKILNNSSEGNPAGGKTTITPQEDGIHYTIKGSDNTTDMSMGSLYQTIRNAEFNGKITNEFGDVFPILKQITNSDDGINIASTFLHSLFPIAKTNTVDEEMVGTILYGILHTFMMYLYSLKDEVSGITDNSNLSDAVQKYIDDNDREGKYNLPSWMNLANKATFDFHALASTNYFDNVKSIADVLDGINTSDIDQNAFWTSFEKSSAATSGLKALFQQLFNGNEEMLNKVKDPEYLTSINLFGLVHKAIDLVGQFSTIKQNYMDNYETLYKDNSFDKVKSNVSALFGWNKDDKKIEDGSLIDNLNGIINDKNNEGNLAMNRFINDDDSIINQSRNGSSNVIWDNLYQYILKDEYWNVKDYSYNKFDENADDNLGDTITYTMDYSGKGDSTVDYNLLSSKTKSVEMTDGNATPKNDIYGKPVLESTEVRYMNGNDGSSYGEDATQMVRKNGGEVAGGLDNLIKMNGLGNVEDLKDVNHKYKVTWQNVSINPDIPYWVVVGINAYNDDNQEYYYYY
jgi:hypothetical protein